MPGSSIKLHAHGPLPIQFINIGYARLVELMYFHLRVQIMHMHYIAYLSV